ncbi:MAG: threonine synthase, partial [Halanaerobiaceae bacterium]
MKYISTRGNYEKISSARAIQLGMVPPGGLFLPEEIPVFSREELSNMQNNSYRETAFQILRRYLTDYTDDELKEVIKKAYNKSNFAVDEIAPVRKLDKTKYILELWHGPTAAFKDIALQLMPYLLVKAIRKVNVEKEIVILVATSGDTGKAALEGFRDVSGVKIIVFFPENGVSKIQELQMVTTGGFNTFVVAVAGNFDDCQNRVKEIFADREFNRIVNNNGCKFSSANSINWGRLVPQIVYYFTSYMELVKNGGINMGEKVNITVPTGNF